MLLELCDIHKDTKEILVPLEILVDIMLYNGPFLIVLLRFLYLAWKVAYDEAVLTGAIFDDGESGSNPLGSTSSGRRAARSGGSHPGAGEYVGLAMVDLDEAERGHGNSAGHQDGENGEADSSKKMKQGAEAEEQGGNVYVLDDGDEDEAPTQTTLSVSSPMSRSRSVSPARSPLRSRSPVNDNVVFDLDDATLDGHDEDVSDNQRDHRSLKQGGRPEDEEPLV